MTKYNYIAQYPENLCLGKNFDIGEFTYINSRYEQWMHIHLLPKTFQIMNCSQKFQQNLRKNSKIQLFRNKKIIYY